MNQSFKTLSLAAILGVCFFAAARAQEGIRFNSQGEFKAVLAESQKTGKLIFMDCYTSWCAPCKWMEKNVFVNDSVAAFFNARFVNYKMDMEKGEGPVLNKRYGVKVYPTYLFLNGKGEVVHKATSRMEADAFMDQARKALDPKRSFTALEKKFNEGDRSNAVLLEYAIALQHFNRQKADSVAQLLIAQLQDKELLTEIGWKTIQQFTWSETERLGAWFLQHRDAYAKKFGEEPVKKMQERLTSSALYGLIRKKDSVAFFTRLAPWKQSSDQDLQRRAFQMEAEYYLTSGNIAGFVQLTNDALKGLMKDDDQGLSFIARRSSYMAGKDKLVLAQAYKMAKRAAEINPEEYSNQSTYAKASQEMGYKEEALKAAEKSYQLALKETSKIQGLAQKLIDEIKAM
ncbi:thioredoxin family protein [Chitinophaga lutea]